MNTQKKITAHDLAMIGVLAALVFAGSWIFVMVPTPAGPTRFHLGNVMCLLAGLLLGPVPGGVAAGVGSMFFDFTNPLFIADAPFTFAFKFLMAFVCGKVARMGGAGAHEARRSIKAAVLGQLTYIVLYLGKGFLESYFFLRMELSPVLITVGTKAVASGINALIAVLIAVPLAVALKKRMGSRE